MIEIVWEFVIKAEARGPFELSYGPGGAWSNLFASSPGFRGITVLRDTRNSRRYLAIEVWDSVAQREQALSEQPVAYAGLGDSLSDWAEDKTEMGVYQMVGEAAVRPRSQKGRTRGGLPVRRGRR